MGGNTKEASQSAVDRKERKEAKGKTKREKVLLGRTSSACDFVTAFLEWDPRSHE